MDAIGLTLTEYNPGYVYVISNPVWPGRVKIGKAKHPYQRLANYQTYDPDRAYRLEGYVFSGDYVHLELLTHRTFADKRERGEWFQVEPEEVFSFLSSYAQVTECK